jgi:hypothetical protein
MTRATRPGEPPSPDHYPPESAPSVLYGLVSTVVGGGGALLLYAICAKLLGIEEFRALVRSVALRLGRLCNGKSWAHASCIKVCVPRRRTRTSPESLVLPCHPGAIR